MINDLDILKYGETSKSTPIIRGIINKKQQLGLSLNPNQILSRELHTQRKINITRRKVISNRVDSIWGCDLITMIKYSKLNKNYKYILTVIDFFSKFSWCYPLKTKKSEEIINSFKDIFKKFKRKPKLIRSDEGSEFTNIQTQTFFKNLYYKVILSVCLFVCLCALGSAKLPNGFEKFFLRLVDLNVDIVRKILDFYMS